MSKLMRIIKKNEPQLQKSYLAHAIQKSRRSESARPERIPAEREMQLLAASISESVERSREMPEVVIRERPQLRNCILTFGQDKIPHCQTEEPEPEQCRIVNSSYRNIDRQAVRVPSIQGDQKATMSVNLLQSSVSDYSSLQNDALYRRATRAEQQLRDIRAQITTAIENLTDDYKDQAEYVKQLQEFVITVGTII